MNSAFWYRRLATAFLLLGVFFVCQTQGKYSDLTGSGIDCLARSLQRQRTQVQLKTECPEIYHALWQNGLTTTLEAPLPEQVSLTQLRLLQASTRLPDKLGLLDASGLDALLADIYIIKPEDQASTWWKQFLAWLDSFKPERYEAEFNWLLKFLEAITPSIDTARIIMYMVFGLIILLAVGLVLRELYLSGVLVRRKRKLTQDTQTEVNAVANAQTRISFAEIKQLAPPGQTIALLKSVIVYLIGKQHLPRNAAMTNFELKHYLQGQNLSIAKPFSQLLADVEPVLYGDAIPSDQALERCWSHAEQIIKP